MTLTQTLCNYNTATKRHAASISSWWTWQQDKPKDQEQLPNTPWKQVILTAPYWQRTGAAASSLPEVEQGTQPAHGLHIPILDAAWGNMQDGPKQSQESTVLLRYSNWETEWQRESQRGREREKQRETERDRNRLQQPCVELAKARSQNSEFQSHTCVIIGSLLGHLSRKLDTKQSGRGLELAFQHETQVCHAALNPLHIGSQASPTSNTTYTSDSGYRKFPWRTHSWY